MTRDLLLKRFPVDEETFDPLDERDFFTMAFNRYLSMGARMRDMYRETLDDLVDASRGKHRFSQFPAKHRSEQKYYIDYWRIRRSESRLTLYQLRRSILLELKMCGIVILPRSPLGAVPITHPPHLIELRKLIAEFEDRCWLELHHAESKLEYDEIGSRLVESKAGQEQVVLRTFKPGKIPEQLFLCLFSSIGAQMTILELYNKMGVKKSNRRFARWREEVGLDREDLKKYFVWKDHETFIFNPVCRETMGRNENMVQFPFHIPKPSAIEKYTRVTRLRLEFSFMGVKFREPRDDLTKRPLRDFFAALMPTCLKSCQHREPTVSWPPISGITE